MADYGALPFAEQLDFFKQKLNLPTERWDDLLGAAHDRAFVVAGALQADLLADLRTAVARAVEQGTTLEEFRKDFTAIVNKHGWSGWTGEGTPAGEAWRTKVIYATNLRTSHAAGRYAQLQEIKHRRPYWRYVHNDTVLHPRPHHLAWDGTVLPADDPWWQTHFAPNGWGCRCRIESLAARDLAREGIDPDALTRPTAPDDLTGIDRGWDYAPGANAATPLRELIDQKLFNLDAPIGAALWERLKGAVDLERELEWWKTLDEWLEDEHQRGRSFVVGAVSTATLDWLAARGYPLPVSAEIAVFDKLPKGAKQRRHEADQNGMTPDEWRSLPALLDRPGAIYYDKKKGTLIFVAEMLGPSKIAVEFAPKDTRSSGGMNQVVTAFRVDDMSIMGAVKGDLWDIVEVSGKPGGSRTHISGE
ncbi:phage minor head protein [Thiocystis violascens]|uniref:Phage head morphogenesis protein, SPP1 gp7 n=1 Tax=Thiocystis violascens (strain ATCC 17096 / DSM 198 / 6111) TaxID=765911 RepID=I3YEH4_THIV6|nr:phage minor head protein [Thiocystis violascens]AFL75392.1 phage head morphogenesis protein, SPP1 gp7 [Thiocystis violascens DSM 198]